LLRLCWGGAVVGDDAINRAIAEIRRIARNTGGFGIETIPRVGYRLTVGTPAKAGGAAAPDAPPPNSATPAPPGNLPALTTRRNWLVGGTLAVSGAALAVVLATYKPRPDPRYLELMDQGRQALRVSLRESNRQAVDSFQKAVNLRPDDAEAWGLLALARFRIADSVPQSDVSAAVQASEQAARRALALDPREPNAQTVLVLLQRTLDDWFTTDRKLREILVQSPRNLPTLSALVEITQAAGYVQESWDFNERAVAVDPMRPVHQQRRAMKHWIMGRPIEADMVIVRAFELWPMHPFVWVSRLLIHAFSGQVLAARNLIDQHSAAPDMLRPEGVAAWRIFLQALESRSPADLDAARTATLDAASRSSQLSVHAIMVLSELGEIDAAFSIVNGLVLRRGPFLFQLHSEEGHSPAQDPQWRQTQWLFTPATRRLRADSRFAALAEAIGLTEFWHRRGIEPDDGLAYARNRVSSLSRQ
jgi:tetratricopeptide (TPR) repeat protein